MAKKEEKKSNVGFIRFCFAKGICSKGKGGKVNGLKGGGYKDTKTLLQSSAKSEKSKAQGKSYVPTKKESKTEKRRTDFGGISIKPQTIESNVNTSKVRVKSNYERDSKGKVKKDVKNVTVSTLSSKRPARAKGSVFGNEISLNKVTSKRQKGKKYAPDSGKAKQLLKSAFKSKTFYE